MYQPAAQPPHLSAAEREARRQEQIRHNQAALEMLNEWDQEDSEEQRERTARDAGVFDACAR